MITSPQPSLYELLRRCTVRINTSDGHGTGFFVAPGSILTCAHVVRAAYTTDQEISITWQEQTLSSRIQYVHPDDYPDVALLEVDMQDHPCVSLQEEVRPFDRLYSFGYPDNYPAGDPVTLDCEGQGGGQQAFLRLKGGQVRPGMSGAPLLNIRTQRVCGMLKMTRDRGSDLGARAIPIAPCFQHVPYLLERQQAYQQQDNAWNKGTTKALEVFFSYSHKDEKLRNELEIHLSILRRQGYITDWHDRKILSGESLNRTIDEHLNTAHIILLLVSPAFLASNYCYEIEMTRALERRENGSAHVIPIILRPCDWQNSPLKDLKATPKDGKPVIKWATIDEAFYDVTQDIRRVVETMINPERP